MSIALMTEVWRLDMPTTEKMVLLALADAANDDGVTWMALESREGVKLDLIKKTSLSRRAVQGALSRLCAAGYLTRSDRPGKGVIWTVKGCTSCTPQQVHRAADAPGGAARAPKPSTNHQPTSEAKASSVAVREPKAKASKRCPADWSPSPADLAVADGEGFTPGEIERELASIRDCEFRNARSDWSAAFRNWIRREAKSRKPRNDPSSRYDAKQSNYDASLAGAGYASEVLAFRRAL